MIYGAPGGSHPRRSARRWAGKARVRLDRGQLSWQVNCSPPCRRDSLERGFNYDSVAVGFLVIDNRRHFPRQNSLYGQSQHGGQVPEAIKGEIDPVVPIVTPGRGWVEYVACHQLRQLVQSDSFQRRTYLRRRGWRLRRSGRQGRDCGWEWGLGGFFGRRRGGCVRN